MSQTHDVTLSFCKSRKNYFSNWLKRYLGLSLTSFRFSRHHFRPEFQILLSPMLVVKVCSAFPKNSMLDWSKYMESWKSNKRLPFAVVALSIDSKTKSRKFTTICTRTANIYIKTFISLFFRSFNFLPIFW